MKQRIILLSILFTFSIMSFASHKVYVIHGFGGFRLQMSKINNSLLKEGYLTENYSYHSFSKDIDSVAKELYTKIKAEKIDTVSFVTHSMGALVVRSLYKNIVSKTEFPIIFRIVMVAPPNKGTEVANIYSCKLTRFFFGPNVDKLKTGDNCFAKSLPIPDCEVGIIAGMKGKKPWYNPSLKDDNDGNVSLNLTALGIEKDAVTIHSTHNLMTIQTKVCKLIVSFMKNGAFDKEFLF